MRLDERRIGEILQGIDSNSMGPAFVSTAGRLLGHLGDVMTLGFTPMAPGAPHGVQVAKGYEAVVWCRFLSVGVDVCGSVLSCKRRVACASCFVLLCYLSTALPLGGISVYRPQPPVTSTPHACYSCLADPKALEEQPSQYLLQFESSDISRLRADVQSLGFASLVT